jgi:hypothetical protein
MIEAASVDCYLSGMKKIAKLPRLRVQVETVKLLTPVELAQAAGGLSVGCAHPTTITFKGDC